MTSALRDESVISQNVSYQQDIRYVFKLNNWILGSLGIWPVAIRGIGQHTSKIAIALCNLALTFAIVPCALHIVYDEKDITMRLKLFGLLAFCLTAMTKYCILAIRRPKILRCIEYVKSDWWQVTFRSDRTMMLKYAATGRNLTIIGASFMYAAGIIYHMILPFCIEHKFNNQTIRPLVYPTYSKFRHSQISPIYEIVYVAHCMCGYTIYSVTAGACGLAALFATHACGQIQMVISRLEDLLDGEKFKQGLNVHQRIAAIVKNHVRVIRFAATVEEVLQEVCLVEFTSSVCTICLLEYYCILDWQADDRVGLATYSLLLVSFCFNVYILCYIGELLMEKSSQIGYICYMINWYQLSPKSARSLILMIAMASHPIKISAGRMVDLSLSTFGNVKYNSDRELMMKYAATGRRLSIISTTSMYIAGFIYHTILPFCTVHKVGNETIRPLVYPIYSEFYQTQISPIYEIVYLAHCVCGYTMYSVTAGSCGLAAIFATHACGQIDVIASRLEDLSQGKNFEPSSNVNQRIAAIVNGHVRILRFCTAVEEILQEVCLLEFASSIFTMCLPEYYCIVDWQDSDTVGLTTYFLLFVSFCFNMYILCYIGELLMAKSSQIGSTCFMIDWYQLPTETVRSLVLIIAISSHPIKISAGRMIDLSLATFGNVLKTSLAYLSFLRTLVM
ncbi:uncharacterized protein [Anoplolepis gracilipes]|uniref:uncharacterized protein n=1 Tax=Anoplolepis gracilipes TaxID=354296 RepID=UPI003BA23841